MDLKTAKYFCKSGVCPSAESLLAFADAELTQTEMFYISAHLSLCDFCSAELHFLTSFPQSEAKCEKAEIPFALKQLAEALLCGARTEFQLLEELISNTEQLTLKNA
jgi:hypothetical protein